MNATEPLTDKQRLGQRAEWSKNCIWGPLEALTDLWPVNGIHPAGHRCSVHSGHLLNVRMPKPGEPITKADPLRVQRNHKIYAKAIANAQ